MLSEHNASRFVSGPIQHHSSLRRLRLICKLWSYFLCEAAHAMLDLGTLLLACLMLRN